MHPRLHWVQTPFLCLCLRPSPRAPYNAPQTVPRARRGTKTGNARGVACTVVDVGGKSGTEVVGHTHALTRRRAKQPPCPRPNTTNIVSRAIKNMRASPADRGSSALREHGRRCVTPLRTSHWDGWGIRVEGVEDDAKSAQSNAAKLPTKTAACKVNGEKTEQKEERKPIKPKKTHHQPIVQEIANCFSPETRLAGTSAPSSTATRGCVFVPASYCQRSERRRGADAAAQCPRDDGHEGEVRRAACKARKLPAQSCREWAVSAKTARRALKSQSLPAGEPPRAGAGGGGGRVIGRGVRGGGDAADGGRSTGTWAVDVEIVARADVAWKRRYRWRCGVGCAWARRILSNSLVSIVSDATSIMRGSFNARNGRKRGNG
ncbi:hypothetical protein B0H13DRAFT_1877392 [Mycena leptocephala]|nr:hypothetical protein B0H13DRAFT_1877392 [Mycena leptocephala]